jgi:hypothetical protein
MCNHLDRYTLAVTLAGPHLVASAVNLIFHDIPRLLESVNGSRVGTVIACRPRKNPIPIGQTQHSLFLIQEHLEETYSCRPPIP